MKNNPPDDYTKTLRENVFPAAWKNPKSEGTYDLLVVGGGPGGMTAATLASALNVKVALVEKEHLGGECLNYGCIPSKALLRISRVIAEMRRAKDFGIDLPKNWQVNFGEVMRKVHELQAVISPHDSPEHFKKLGIDVFFGEGHFISENQLEVKGQTLTFKKAILATGTHPIPLEVPGLEESDYYTNQDIFQIASLPARLGVVGMGPISCELSQAFLRLGSKVSLISHGTLLPKEEPASFELLCKVFEKEGMQIFTKTPIERVEKKGDVKVLHLKKQTIEVDALLVAIGRKPAVDGLSLEKAGVKFDHREGIHTNEFLQTSNPHIYAIGDVTSKYKFTHVSQELASVAVGNALKGQQRSSHDLIIPWCTYTDPEIAHVGLSLREAEAKGIPLETVTIPLENVDRAIVDQEATGFVKLWVKKNTNQILGADIIAAHAGDLIAEIGVAMNSADGLQVLAKTIHPFPTQAQSIRMAAQTILENRG